MVSLLYLHTVDCQVNKYLRNDILRSVAQQPVSNPGGDYIFSIALAIIATMKTKRLSR